MSNAQYTADMLAGTEPPKRVPIDSVHGETVLAPDELAVLSDAYRVSRRLVFSRPSRDVLERAMFQGKDEAYEPGVSRPLESAKPRERAEGRGRLEVAIRAWQEAQVILVAHRSLDQWIVLDHAAGDPSSVPVIHLRLESIRLCLYAREAKQPDCARAAVLILAIQLAHEFCRWISWLLPSTQSQASDNRDRFGLQMGQQNRKRRSENPDATTGLSTLSLKDGHLCWQEQVMGGCIGVTIGFDFFRRIHQIIRIVYLANPSDRDSRIIISTHEMDAILDGGSFDYQYQLKPTATAGWEDELMIFKGKWYDTRFKLHEPRLCRARHVPLVEYEEGCEPEEDLTPHHREEFLE